MTQPSPSIVDAGRLAAWLAAGGWRLQSLEALPGDLSPRRYSRLALADGSSAILASYPEPGPEPEPGQGVPGARNGCERFLATSGLLEGAGVRVPRILAADCQRGWMLLEDLGPCTLADLGDRSWNELAGYFAAALAHGQRIAGLPAAAVADLNPPLGRELLARELAQTWEVFLAPNSLTGDPPLAAALRQALDEVCDRLGAEPPVPCHRDFMARNLMPLPERPGIGVLDHQDLRLGPPLYDLASLLNDTLFPPPALEEELLAAALGSATVPPAGRERYHRAAAQRTLKAVGTYASFARRGAERHLPLIPPTLGRCLGHLARIPEGAPVAAALAAAWRPALGAASH
jgi:N-acetylmuramate 1-kinase